MLTKLPMLAASAKNGALCSSRAISSWMLGELTAYQSLSRKCGRCFSSNPRRVDTFSRSSIDTYIFGNIQYSMENIRSSLESVKGTLLQVMAKRMNEQDIIAMANHWGKKLSDDKPIESVSSTVHPKAPLPLHEQPTEDSVGTLSTRMHLPAENQHAEVHHPLLGEQVANLGYKTLYLTSVKSLVLTPVWKKQRILRPERAALIAKDKVRSGLASSMSGTIALYMHRRTKEIGIIDGQHRAAALMILAQEGHWDDSLRNVLIEVHSVDNMAQVSALFREINSAEPVRMIDLVEHEADSQDESNSQSPLEEKYSTTSLTAVNKVETVATNQNPIASTKATKTIKKINQADHIAILTEAIETLAKLKPDMFKPSSRCKPPHLNIDVLRDDLFQSDFLQRHSLLTSSDLLTKLHELNQKQKGSIPQTYAVEMSKSMQSATQKAFEHDFFLGLDKAWMYK